MANDKFYGRIIAIQKSGDVFWAQGTSEDASSKGHKITILLGETDRGLAPEERVSIYGQFRQDGVLVAGTGNIKKYADKPKKGKGNTGWKDRTFEMSVGNATNVVHKMYDELTDEELKKEVLSVYQTSKRLKALILGDFSNTRDESDIGAKVGAALLVAAENGAGSNRLEEEAEKLVRQQIELEEYIKNNT